MATDVSTEYWSIEKCLRSFFLRKQKKSHLADGRLFIFINASALEWSVL